MEVTLQKREKRSRLSFSLFFRQISWHNWSNQMYNMTSKTVVMEHFTFNNDFNSHFGQVVMYDKRL
jgi:hypothetical protein